MMRSASQGTGPLVYEVDRSGVVRILRGRERQLVLVHLFGVRTNPTPPPAREGETEPPPRKEEE